MADYGMETIIGAAGTLGGGVVMGIIALLFSNKAREGSEKRMAASEIEHRKEIQILQDEHRRSLTEVIESYRSECSVARQEYSSLVERDQSTREKNTEAITELTTFLKRHNGSMT